MPADTKLYTNGAVFSSDCKSKLVLQEDRNLVAYDSNNRVLWASNTQGNMSIDHLLFQWDGNMLLRDDKDRIVWSAGEYDYPKGPHQLKLENDGPLRVIDQYGGILWPKPEKIATWQATTTLYTATATATATRTGTTTAWRKGMPKPTSSTSVAPTVKA